MTLACIGLLAGASLDQSIKQLPARHRIGSVAYSQYSRASDLGRGILFYAILGVGSAALCIAAAIAAALQGLLLSRAVPIYAGAVLALLHTLATTQEVAPDDEAGLAGVFDRFARWQAVRCVLQVINFGVNLWAVVSLTGY